ncbi:hypothetical protein RHGRI_014567 [Rhododendron griersonianum]|uniref:Galactose oxidase/kelch repeat superfamily protein n=1 Tax=Rhododendron griersonianum TaxID=479676 RepID=A0AAV6KA40_9ERIC|nr:hypothetical protein RHGRI_014567 [Rhododendron griersonianum]
MIWGWTSTGSVCLELIVQAASAYGSNGEELKETQWYVFHIGSSGEDCLSLEIERLNKLLKTADRCQKFGVQRVVEDVVKEEEEKDKEHQQPVPNSRRGRRLFPPPEIPPPITTHTSPSSVWIWSAVLDSVLYRIGDWDATDVLRLRLLEEGDGSRNSSSTWTRGPSMVKSRTFFKMVSLDGKLFVFCGDGLPDDLWAEFLDPKGANVWTPLPQPPACFCVETTGAFVTSTDSPQKKVLVGSLDLGALFAFHLTDQRWEVLFNRSPEELGLPPLTARNSTPTGLCSCASSAGACSITGSHSQVLETNDSLW